MFQHILHACNLKIYLCIFRWIPSLRHNHALRCMHPLPLDNDNRTSNYHLIGTTPNQLNSKDYVVSLDHGIFSTHPNCAQLNDFGGGWMKTGSITHHQNKCLALMYSRIYHLYPALL